LPPEETEVQNKFAAAFGIDLARQVSAVKIDEVEQVCETLVFI
jgi:hypothetical protein